MSTALSVLAIVAACVLISVVAYIGGYNRGNRP